MIKLVLFDFGGVVAEEGFREGLRQIGRKNGLDPERFYSIAEALIHETGYVTGQRPEAEYWKELRKRTGVRGTDTELREEILGRFVLRPRVLSCIDGLRSRGYAVAMLSDQTNWLDEINEKTDLFAHFDRIYNSYHFGRSKRDASVFPDVCREMGAAPEETVFVDDNGGHIGRAGQAGLRTIHFSSVEACEQRMESLVRTR